MFFHIFSFDLRQCAPSFRWPHAVSLPLDNELLLDQVVTQASHEVQVDPQGPESLVDRITTRKVVLLCDESATSAFKGDDGSSVSTNNAALSMTSALLMWLGLCARGVSGCAGRPDRRERRPPRRIPRALKPHTQKYTEIRQLPREMRHQLHRR